MTSSKIRRGLFGGMVAVALAAGATVMTTANHSQAQEGEGLRIGTYQQDLVFSGYHALGELMQEFQELQMEAQQAQQEGNQEQMMQLQQRLQEAQQNIIGTYESALDEALPEVAEETGVDVIALEVVYTAEGIEPQDVTENLLEKLNDGEEAPEPMVPDMGVGQ
ncbi:hypothetical protein ACERK3_15560 [Phycisphaerales bacterium AB-hyl4]|uniref:Periplasmic chaperone for outer membrane proteins Skp n=1 Tax=Natronomicrosphaera hydrolytica TaxID=3242702 RepID=A0ABV4U7X3_9BACT